MDDQAEKGYGDKSSFSTDASPPAYEGTSEPIVRRGFGGFIDSFKPDPAATVVPSGVVGADGEVVHTEKNQADQLSHSLKNRHLQMIAIGGSIGTGLFVGSGSALSGGGPASLVIDFGLIGIMLFCTVHALGELAVRFPVAGSFAAYSSRFIDPAWGFAMGWNYALGWRQR